MFVPNSLHELAKRDEVENQGGRSRDPVTKPANSMCTVLVVDDDPMSRSVAVRALKEIATVYQAETGFEALHMLTLHEDVDIVMLDLRMPGQHGLETLKEIRKLRDSAKVVIVSGFANEVMDDVDDLVVKVVEKPVTVQMLQDAIIEVNE